MTCPECGSEASSVYDTRRRAGGWVYRRRECADCNGRYTTREGVVHPNETTPEVLEEAVIEEIRWFLTERLKELRKVAP